MSQDSGILGSICAGCSLFLFSAFEPWCNTKRYGCGNCSCSGPRGCCNSCFARGFNEDSWDREDARRRAPEGEGGAGEDIKDGDKTRVNGEQPAPVADMSVTLATGDAVAPRDQAEGSKKTGEGETRLLE